MTDLLDINFTPLTFRNNFPTEKGGSMKQVIASALVLLFTLVSTASAAIVCEGKTSFGNLMRLEIKENRSAHLDVINQDGSIELEQDFKNFDAAWDNHMTGLITAPGLSVKYENQFGRIVDVVITANVRGGITGYIESVHIRACRGEPGGMSRE